jgi:mono/diheme cytochrome c family protein
MKATAATTLIFTVAISFSTMAFAQQRVDVGKREFETNCAVCHGVNAIGGGLYTAHLKITPPDLTILAKRNGGVFPINDVYEAIDGRKQIAPHGTRDMPIWGTRYSIRAAEHYVDVPYEGEAYVRNRILLLIDYLYRIQQK